MAGALEFFLDDAASERIRRLWRRLAGAGVATPTGRPRVTFALGTTIPRSARKALAVDLGRLSLPDLWLATLGTTIGQDDALVLAAVVDAELIAVHAAVHDALAGRVRGISAYHLPGSWLPHCVLAKARPAEAFALLHPVLPIRAAVTTVGIADTTDGEVDELLTR